MAEAPFRKCKPLERDQCGEETQRSACHTNDQDGMVLLFGERSKWICWLQSKAVGEPVKSLAILRYWPNPGRL